MAFCSYCGFVLTVGPKGRDLPCDNTGCSTSPSTAFTVEGSVEAYFAKLALRGVKDHDLLDPALCQIKAWEP